MAKVSESTIERYVSLWKKLESSNVRLDTLDKITFTEFKNKTSLTSESQFDLAKALARNPERQKQVNTSLDKQAILKTKVKRTPEIESIPKVKKEKIIKEKRIEVQLKDISELKFPKKEGKYGIVELIDSNEPSKWIKYKSKRDLERQLEILIDSDSLEKEYDVIFHGFGIYHEYTEREFKRLMIKA